MSLIFIPVESAKWPLTSGDYQVNRPGRLRVDEGGFWLI